VGGGRPDTEASADWSAGFLKRVSYKEATPDGGSLEGVKLLQRAAPGGDAASMDSAGEHLGEGPRVR